MTVQSPAPTAPGRLELQSLQQAVQAFNAAGQLGTDPMAALYEGRRKTWSLFTPGLRDEEMETLRAYIFPYRELPSTPDAKPVPAYNLINGQWKKPRAGKTAVLHTLWDNRVPLTEVADSQPEDVEDVIDAAWS